MFNKPFRFILIVILALFLFACLLPVWITKLSWISLGVDHPNEIGDTIGGILGPVVGFIGVVVTFLAFWMQYKANEKQFKKFDDQDNDTKIERFEYKFYELLKIHRENVSEFEIVRNDGKENLKGRRVFVEMFNELEYTYSIIKAIADKLNSTEVNKNDTYSDKDVFDLAYLIFYNGFNDWAILDTEPNSLAEFHLLDARLNPLIIECLKFLADIRKRQSIQLKGNPQINNVEYPLPNVNYKMFSGHNSRLGHYFRNLFQIVAFIVKSDPVIENKYSYIKTIRAQLSNHEQLLLFYNSLSIFGQPWLENNYLDEWGMIKNMPLGLARFYLSPKDIFREKNSRDEFVFEVDEIAARNR